MGLSAPTLKILPLLEGARMEVYSRIEGLSETEASRVPEGFRNSVHWHIGHMLHVQLAHWYTRRDQPLPVEIGGPKYFRDGKSPADYDAGTPSFADLLAIYREYSFDLARKFGDILEEPMTRPFEYLRNPFVTVADDLFLLLYHEGEHFPMVVRLLRAIRVENPG